jgi:hypothetical protein
MVEFYLLHSTAKVGGKLVAGRLVPPGHCTRVFARESPCRSISDPDKTPGLCKTPGQMGTLFSDFVWFPETTAAIRAVQFLSSITGWPFLNPW